MKKSSGNIPKLRLKKSIKLARHDPSRDLLDEKLISQAFWECLKENDYEGAVEIISAHQSACNKVRFCKRSRTSTFNYLP